MYLQKILFQNMGDVYVWFDTYIHEVSEIESRDIDYPEDFEIADAIYMNVILPGGYFNESC